jgi:type I restriction enzyme, S subunit
MVETKNTKAFYNTEIPSDWEFQELASLGKVSSGGTPDTSNEIYWNGNINWCTPTDITKLNGSKYIGETVVKITEKGFKSSSASLLPIGSVIVCTRATIGKAAISIEEITTNQGFKNIIPNSKKVDVEFLYYSIINSEHKLLRLGNGSTFLEVSKSDFESLKIPLPPLPEQKAIAQVLSTSDAAIHTTEKLIAQKELRKKWLMQQLLTGKKRLKGFDGEWKEKRLSDLFDRVTRKNTEGNTTVVTISAQRGFVRQTDFFNKNIASEITENYFLVERGEFCYNKSYSNGYPWGATKRLNDFNKAVVTTLYICFGVKDEKKTNPEFFEQYFGANHLDKGLTKIAHEGGRAHGLLNVTPSDFFSLKVTIPSYEEQTAIAQVLQAADKEIKLLKAKAEKLREQKKGLMQVLLTGKKRLNYDSSDLYDGHDSDNVLGKS